MLQCGPPPMRAGSCGHKEIRRRAVELKFLHGAVKIKPSGVNPIHQYLIRDRIGRLRRASYRAYFRPPAILQPGGGPAGAMGGRSDDGNADLRCDLRSVDWRMVGSHALAMGPASSVHVRFSSSGRGRILLPVQTPTWMAEESSAHIHDCDVSGSASAAQPL